jgi:hypothetical protein
MLKLSINSEPLPPKPHADGERTTKMTRRAVSNVNGLDDLQRLSTKTLYILAGTTVMLGGLFGLLAYLWFGSDSSSAWKWVMINGWATRSVAIIALVVRTSVDLQAAIGSAIIASLLLESKVGIDFRHLATMSPIRAGTTSLWTLTRCAYQDFWWSSAVHRRSNYPYCLVAGFLIITTSILQFSSTILLSDISLGSMVGHEYASQVQPGLSYSQLRIAEKIPRDSAWTTNPPFYPVYAEFYEPATNVTVGTGSLLRALLPYATAEERQSISTYSGNALILDAKVTCQAPAVADLTTNSTYGHVNGTISPSDDGFQYLVSCFRGGTTICQLSQGFNTPSDLLKSQFENSTAPGAVFLVTAEGATRNHAEEWLHLPKKNLSVSICHAPWDAAILDVDLISDVNRTEPMLQYDRSVERYETSAVVEHFLPTANRTIRQIMTMRKPLSFLGDLPPKQRRPIVQSDMGGQFALAKGGSGPLPGGWTAFMSGDPLITMLRRFTDNSTEITNAIAADPALAAIFNNTLEASSVSWAMSNLLTILSMSNYYSQQAAFDRVDNVTISSFENVLYPRDYLGFMFLLGVLAAHFIIMATLIVMFVTNTRSTLLGNAWPALAQILESKEVREHIEGASTKSDSKILKELKEACKEGFRARVVHREEGTEVIVLTKRI